MFWIRWPEIRIPRQKLYMYIGMYNQPGISGVPKCGANISRQTIPDPPLAKQYYLLFFFFLCFRFILFSVLFLVLTLHWAVCFLSRFLLIFLCYWFLLSVWLLYIYVCVCLVCSFFFGLFFKYYFLSFAVLFKVLPDPPWPDKNIKNKKHKTIKK